MSTDFNGSNSYITVSNVAIASGAMCGITWALWDGAGQGTIGAFFGDNDFALCFNGNSSTLWGNLRAGTDAQSKSGGFATATWYCICMTFDPADNKLRLYWGTEYQRMAEVSSYSQQTAAITPSYANGAAHYAGNWSGQDRSFDGRLRHHVMMNYLLTLAEMERFRQGDLTVPFRKGIPHAYFPLGGGNTLIDSSRRSGGTSVVTTANLANSAQEPLVQFRWDWSRPRPL